MSETIIQTASLIGHVIEDLTYESLTPSQFQAELVGTTQVPQYKPGGFFVFSDLMPDTYILRLMSQRFQAFEQSLTLPQPGLLIEAPGSNEVFVIVSSADDTGIAFDTVFLTHPIRAGASLLGPAGYAATLAATLEPGRVMEATIENSTGTLASGAVVRIIRERSVRLRFHAFATLPFVRAHLVGTIRRQNAPQIPLHGAQVRLTHVNGVMIVLHDVAGVTINTVVLNGTTTILGAEQDIATASNHNGDFNLYFSRDIELESVTVGVTLAGYQAQTLTTAMRAGQRQFVTISLAEA